ncbi:MAG: hypothetical protein SVG88_02000 [Halobacteriales archaeon]|nr:hypothetical protein [Halobacteriales archaeon]
MVNDPAEQPESDPEPGGRPVQITPSFFAETVEKHVDRDEVTGGICALRFGDDSVRRFVIDPELSDLNEEDYAAKAAGDLLDLLGDEGLTFDREIEVRIPVGDPDRVIEEVETSDTVTLQLDTAAVRTLIAGIMDGFTHSD